MKRFSQFFLLAGLFLAIPGPLFAVTIDDCSKCLLKKWQGGFSTGGEGGDGPVYTLAFCVPDLDGTYGNCETYNVDEYNQRCRTGPSTVSYGNCEMGITPLPGFPYDPWKNWPNLIGSPEQRRNQLFLQLYRQHLKI